MPIDLVALTTLEYIKKCSLKPAIKPGEKLGNVSGSLMLSDLSNSCAEHSSYVKLGDVQIEVKVYFVTVHV